MEREYEKQNQENRSEPLSRIPMVSDRALTPAEHHEIYADGFSAPYNLNENIPIDIRISPFLAIKF